MRNFGPHLLLIEAVLSVLNATPWRLRRLGLVGESVGLWGRGVRQRRAWAEHHARCRGVVERALATLSRRRTAVVLGSGLLRDVPAKLLATAFEHVILVDAVHLLPARLAMARYGNVTFRTLDLTGAAAWLTGAEAARSQPLAALQADPSVDLVISANVLSQLPIRPEGWLETHPARAAALPADFGDRMIGWHLDDLRGFSCRVVLLTDVVMREEDKAGTVHQRLDLMRGHALPRPDETWDWPVAPFGEEARHLRYVHEVQAFGYFR